MRTKGDKGTCAMGAPGCSLLSLWGTLSLSLIELSLGGVTSTFLDRLQ